MAKTYNHYFSELSIEDAPDQLITYETTVHLRMLKDVIKALIDGGTIGGIGGNIMTLIGNHPEHKKVNVGIAGDHQMTGRPLAIFTAAMMICRGLITAIFHNYAKCTSQAQSIHSKI